MVLSYQLSGEEKMTVYYSIYDDSIIVVDTNWRKDDGSKLTKIWCDEKLQLYTKYDWYLDSNYVKLGTL